MDEYGEYRKKTEKGNQLLKTQKKENLTTDEHR
jgi:hypothetical protein